MVDARAAQRQAGDVLEDEPAAVVGQVHEHAGVDDRVVGQRGRDPAPHAVGDAVAVEVAGGDLAGLDQGVPARSASTSSGGGTSRTTGRLEGLPAPRGP